MDVLNTDHLHADLRGRSVRGGLQTLTSQSAQFVIQSVATVVLARLLTPADFGLVAMVSTITNLGQAFADLGLSEATIQRKEITHDQVSVLFWINFAIGLGLMFVTASLAPVFVRFYRDPRLMDITLAISFTFLIGGLRVQPDAILRRQMRFSALAYRDVGAYALAVPVAIAIAWRGGSYWALVALPLTLNSFQMVVSWILVKWTPSLPRKGTGVGSMISFGGNVAASYFVMSVIRSADNILVGRYLGAAPLGFYSKAYNLLMLPLRQLSGPAGAVAVPAFSRVQHDPERFARFYLRAVNLIMWISAPAFAFLFVAARPVIILALGHRWLEAAPVFQILVISALGQLLLDSTVMLFISRGQSSQLLRLLLLVSPVIVASYAIGLPFGIRGVALTGSLVLIALLPWMLKFAFRGTDLTLPQLGRSLVYPVSLSIVTILVAKLALHLLVPQHVVSQLVVVATSFAVAYSLSALISPVRAEMMSLWKLLGDLRVSKGIVDPVV
ncbi:MAG: lipopolysaccharide biosynthesis protein [Candidatus Acidiferrales bacterium]